MTELFNSIKMALCNCTWFLLTLQLQSGCIQHLIYKDSSSVCSQLLVLILQKHSVSEEELLSAVQRLYFFNITKLRKEMLT